MATKVVETAMPSDLPGDRTLNGPKAKGVRRTLRLLHLILQPTHYMDENVQRYGPTFKLGGESSPPFIYVGDPEVVREIFQLDATQALTGQGNGISQEHGG